MSEKYLCKNEKCKNMMRYTEKDLGRPCPDCGQPIRMARNGTPEDEALWKAKNELLYSYLYARLGEEGEKRPRPTAGPKGIKGIKGWRLMQEAQVDALCERLRGISLDATVESKETKWKYIQGIRWKFIQGAVRVADRNIDLVELEREPLVDDTGYTGDTYRCNYVVWTKAIGSEYKVEWKPVRKGLLSREIVDLRWEGKELAQMLNSDADLKDALLRMKNKFQEEEVPLHLEIKPFRKHQCIRIRQIDGVLSPVAAFPTAETFETFDRIAKHVRNIGWIDEDPL